jgi:hypothetical protein
LRTDRWILAGLVLAVLPFGAAAQGTPSPGFEQPMRDPWVPPAAREKSTLKLAPITEGAELDAQVDAKLRARFAAAAKEGGTLTREQARAAGLGAIAENFAAIDRQGRGVVTFEDYRRYLRERRPN